MLFLAWSIIPVKVESQVGTIVSALDVCGCPLERLCLDAVTRHCANARVARATNAPRDQTPLRHSAARCSDKLAADR